MAYQNLATTLPAQAAAGATLTTILADAPSQQTEPSFIVTKLSLTSPSLVTGAVTNFATISFRQMRAGALIATIGTYALNAAAVTLPAETETDVPVLTAPTILAKDTIDVQQIQSGTGLALPAGILARCELA